jgi:hypothetical protein
VSKPAGVCWQDRFVGVNAAVRLSGSARNYVHNRKKAVECGFADDEYRSGFALLRANYRIEVSQPNGPL